MDGRGRMGRGGWRRARRADGAGSADAPRVMQRLDAGGGGIRPAAAGRVRWRQGRFRPGFAREFRGEAIFIGRGS